MSELFLSTVKQISTLTYADYYQALYWYCSENHAGQNDLLYTILSRLQYKPSLTEKSADCLVTINSDYHARCIYMALQLQASVQEHLAYVHPLPARTDIYCVEFSRNTDRAYRVYHIDCDYLIIHDLTQQDN
jgi:hypothetical protein